MYLDGSSLNVETLLSLAAQKLDRELIKGRGIVFAVVVLNSFFVYSFDLATKPEFTIDLTAEAWANVRRSRSVVDKIIKENRVVYGITTGFGNFSNVVIPLDKIEEVLILVCYLSCVCCVVPCCSSPVFMCGFCLTDWIALNSRRATVAIQFDHVTLRWRRRTVGRRASAGVVDSAPQHVGEGLLGHSQRNAASG